MKHFTLRPFLAATAASAFIFGSSLTSVVRADEPAAIGSVAATNLDDLDALAKELSVPLPPFLTGPGIEGQFPFIGDGNLDTKQPIGIVFIGGDELEMSQSAVISLPIKNGGAPLDKIKEMGAKNVEGKSDTVLADNNMPFRRTQGSLMFGGTVDTIGTVNDKSLTKGAAFSLNDSLIVATVDLATVRKVMPQKFAQFVKEMGENANQDQPADDADKAGQEYGSKLVTDLVEKQLQRLDAAITQTDYTLSLKVAAAPVNVQAPNPTAYAKPAFPAGILCRVDLAYANQKDAQWSVAVIDKLIEVSKALDNAGLKPADAAKVRKLVLKTVSQFAAADAMSLAVAPSGDKVVVYAVNQYADTNDFAGAVKKLVTEAQSLAKSMQNDEEFVKVSEYDAGGKTVTRVSALDTGKVVGCVDIVQVGNTVAMAFAADDGQHVADLLTNRAQGNLTRLCEGSIDLAAVLDMASKMPDSPLAGMDDAQKKQIQHMFHGQKVTFGAQPTGDSIAIDLTLPKELIRNGVKLALPQTSEQKPPGGGM
jgi:hypothetical protein